MNAGLPGSRPVNIDRKPDQETIGVANSNGPSRGSTGAFSVPTSVPTGRKVQFPCTPRRLEDRVRFVVKELKTWQSRAPGVGTWGGNSGKSTTFFAMILPLMVNAPVNVSKAMPPPTLAAWVEKFPSIVAAVLLAIVLPERNTDPRPTR